MAQVIRACMISLYFVAGLSLTLYGYDVLRTTISSLFQTTYNPTNFQGTDTFSTDMRATLTDIRTGQ